MKTAKEMFEKLGYGLNPLTTFDDWVVYGDLMRGNIIFDKTYKHVICNVTITPELHKAIHQQLKELNWL